jgi:hypothetical protein
MRNGTRAAINPRHSRGVTAVEKLLTTAAIIGGALTGSYLHEIAPQAAAATERPQFAFVNLPDFSDHKYSCDKEVIEEAVSHLIENGPGGKIGMHLLYIKDQVVEVSRTTNELRCRIYMVTNLVDGPAMFRFFIQDGHVLQEYVMGQGALMSTPEFQRKNPTPRSLEQEVIQRKR